MSRLQMVSLLLRLLGIYIFFSDLGLVIVSVAGIFGSGMGLPPAAVFAGVGATSLKLLVALGLMIFPVQITKMLTPMSGTELVSDDVVTADDIALIVFAALGLYFLVPAVSSLLSPLQLMVMSGKGLNIYGDWHSLLTYVVIPLIHLAVGVWLLFGARGLLSFVKRLRTMHPSS